MSGIAMFVPNEEIYQLAAEVLKEKDNHITVFQRVTVKDAVAEARKVISEGVNIIIARGRHAAQIRQYTNIPVVEMILTAQEMGLLVVKARDIVKKENPKIGVFVWGGMICDTTYFDQLYQVQLKRYQLEEDEEWRNVVEKALGDGLDIIIGGDAALECAYQMGVPGVFLASTGESIRVAIKNAESLYQMSIIEQYNYAQFTTVLDSSFNGIMKVSITGTVLIMNRVMEQITGVSADQGMGQSAVKLLKGLDINALEEILRGERENYNTFLNILDYGLVVVVEPIVAGGRIDGAIISCNRMKRLEMKDKKMLGDQYLKGYVAYGTFDDIDRNLKGMRRVVDLAKIYAQSSSPMLIEAMSGPELEAVCQGIHNYSLRKNGPFIMINLAGMTEDQQMKILFGYEDQRSGIFKSGVIEEADRGTLVLQSVDKLSLPTQFNLIKTIRSKRLVKDDIEEAPVIDTRIIACTAKNLTEIRNQGQMRSDLYFTLKSLRLKIPNLVERKEDVEFLLKTFIKKYMDQYSRYHVLTAGAKRVILEYPWEGNSIQLEAFCERMILTVEKRSITEAYVRELLEELYLNDSSITELPKESTILSEKIKEKDPLLKLLEETLIKYNGNRTLTAKALNMSTTTLWRKIKKYGLDEKH